MKTFPGQKAVPAPSGFTLVELLVAVAIIAVLMGLLLAAVQRSREQANRASCQNNLKQIGVALQNYYSVHSVFPPGYVSSFDAMGNDTGPGWGWAAKALPFLEQIALYDQIQWTLPIEVSQNAVARVQIVPGYLCPSDTADPTWTAVRRSMTGTPTGTICPVATSNYVGVFGVAEPGVDGEGIFFRNSAVTVHDIMDGTSNTLIVGERYFRWCEATWVGSVTGADIYPPSGSPAAAMVQHASGMTLAHTFEGPPHVPGTECNNFSSRHEGGAFFAFADGHVSFLTSSVPIPVFRALSTRSGGESLPGDY